MKLYSIGLVSAKHQHESAMGIQKSPLSHIAFKLGWVTSNQFKALRKQLTFVEEEGILPAEFTFLNFPVQLLSHVRLFAIP